MLFRSTISLTVLLSIFETSLTVIVIAISSIDFSDVIIIVISDVIEIAVSDVIIENSDAINIPGNRNSLECVLKYSLFGSYEIMNNKVY